MPELVCIDHKGLPLVEKQTSYGPRWSCPITGCTVATWKPGLVAVNQKARGVFDTISNQAGSCASAEQEDYYLKEIGSRLGMDKGKSLDLNDLRIALHDYTKVFSEDALDDIVASLKWVTDMAAWSNYKKRKKEVEHLEKMLKNAELCNKSWEAVAKKIVDPYTKVKFDLSVKADTSHAQSENEVVAQLGKFFLVPKAVPVESNSYPLMNLNKPVGFESTVETPEETKKKSKKSAAFLEPKKPSQIVDSAKKRKMELDDE